MRLIYCSAKVVLATLLLGMRLFGQSAAPAFPPRTFRIQGEIRNFLHELVAGAKVEFQGEGKSVTVQTDGNGAYRADLPWGSYTMTVPYSELAVPDYQRPLFRVASSTTLTLNVAIRPAPPCEPTVTVEKPTLTEDDLRNVCGGDERVEVPSNDGVPFELFIRYPWREPTKGGYVYHGRVLHGMPVFVAYDLFTLEADQVTYDAGTHTLEATGHVVLTDVSGTEKRAEFASFKIADGRATQVR